MSPKNENIIDGVTLAKVFLTKGLPKSVRILDLACGTGIVAEELKSQGYHDIDGLDPVEGYLTTAQASHLYKVSQLFRCTKMLFVIMDFRKCFENLSKNRGKLRFQTTLTM